MRPVSEKLLSINRNFSAREDCAAVSPDTAHCASPCADNISLSLGAEAVNANFAYDDRLFRQSYKRLATSANKIAPQIPL